MILGSKQLICIALYCLLVALFVKILLGFEWKGRSYLKGKKNGREIWNKDFLC